MWSHKGTEITTLHGHTGAAGGCAIHVKIKQKQGVCVRFFFPRLLFTTVGLSRLIVTVLWLKIHVIFLRLILK